MFWFVIAPIPLFFGADDAGGRLSALSDFMIAAFVSSAFFFPLVLFHVESIPIETLLLTLASNFFFLGAWVAVVKFRNDY